MIMSTEMAHHNIVVCQAKDGGDRLIVKTAMDLVTSMNTPVVVVAQRAARFLHLFDVFMLLTGNSSSRSFCISFPILAASTQLTAELLVAVPPLDSEAMVMGSFT